MEGGLPEDSTGPVMELALDDETTKLVPAAALPATSSTRKKPFTRAQKCRRLAEGSFLLLAVAVIWVAAAALAQDLLADRNLPVFLTWVNVSMFMLLLPFRWAREKWSCRFCPGRRAEANKTCRLEKAAPSDWKAAARAGAIVAIPWFLAQGSYNASLSGTSVSSSTVLSTTSCVFTFGLSLLFLKEPFRWAKLAGVALTLAGAAMVAFSDRSTDSADNGQDKWWGDALALFSAAMYGVYTLLIKKLVPEQEPSTSEPEGQAPPASGNDEEAAATPVPSTPVAIHMQAFFGFLGLANAVFLAPVVGALQGLKVEDPARGLPLSFIGLMLLKGLFDNVISDLLWARAIQLTSPTVATVGLSLTIPLAMLSDLVVKHKVPAGLMVAGSVSVAIGFLLVTVSVDDSVLKAVSRWAREQCRRCGCGCCCMRAGGGATSVSSSSPAIVDEADDDASPREEENSLVLRGNDDSPSSNTNGASSPSSPKRGGLPSH